MPAEEQVTPATRASLTADLRSLGLEPGATVLVHTSLSALGWVVGGEQAVLQALRDAVGPSGTLVMPTQSWQLCDPAYLNHPAVARAWWPLIRDHLPAYDPRTTPTRTMGAVAELFRTIPGSRRSAHPHRSFAANGPQAQAVVARHDLDSPVGEASPLRAMYEADSFILLLGVGHAKSTGLHLAEHRSDYPGKHQVRNGAPLLERGHRVWRSWEELWVDEHDFEDLARAFAEQTGLQRTARVAQASAHLVRMVGIVDFATAWFPLHRTADMFGVDTTAWQGEPVSGGAGRPRFAPAHDASRVSP